MTLHRYLSKCCIDAAYSPKQGSCGNSARNLPSMNTITTTYMFINSGVQTFREPFAALSRSFATAAKTYIHMCRCHSDTKSLAWVLERLPCDPMELRTSIHPTHTIVSFTNLRIFVWGVLFLNSVVSDFVRILPLVYGSNAKVQEVLKIEHPHSGSHSSSTPKQNLKWVVWEAAPSFSKTTDLGYSWHRNNISSKIVYLNIIYIYICIIEHLVRPCVIVCACHGDKSW